MVTERTEETNEIETFEEACQVLSRLSSWKNQLPAQSDNIIPISHKLLESFAAVHLICQLLS
jgi:hypothetical protein